MHALMTTFKLWCAAALLVALLALPAAAERPVAYVIEVGGEIESALARIISRGIDEAGDSGARALILHMDTYGGRVNAAEEIMQALSRATVPTYTYVDTKAISAGALIAASTGKIYMAPQSQIGDAKLIAMSPIPLMGGAEEIDESVKEKAYSAVRAFVRSGCERHGHPWDIFEAMMDESIAISNVIEEGKLLTLTSQEAVELGVAQAIVGSIPALLEEIGLEDARVVKLETRSTERFARFLNSYVVAGLLLIFGLGGLFIEVRTPGIGVPGIVGVVCLALFFYGHMLTGLSGWLEIILFVVGVALLLVEVFIIPGFGITGILGIGCMFLALVLAMIEWAPGSGIALGDQLIAPIAVVAAAVVGSFALLWAAAKFIPRAPGVSAIFLDKTMKSDEGYVSGDTAAMHSWIGKKGVAKTILRPAGKAVIDGTLLDVVTTGDFVASGTPVRVVSADNNRIMVEPQPAEEAPTA
jgi:membrane-bound serine protease (ClpP class)